MNDTDASTGARRANGLYRVVIEDSGEDFMVREEQTVLDGMAALGRRGIPSGCHGGGCGICKIQVLEGEYRSLPMSRKHISAAEEGEGLVLACRIRPLADIRLRVIGRMKKSVLGGGGIRDLPTGTTTA